MKYIPSKKWPIRPLDASLIVWKRLERLERLAASRRMTIEDGESWRTRCEE
jgi:hypothetical protein